MSLERIAANRLTYLARAWAAWRARAAGVTFGADPFIGRGVDFNRGLRDGAFGRIHLGHRATIDQGAVLHAYGGEIALGDEVFVGPYAVIYGHGGVTIGNHALISMHCAILSSNHAQPARSLTIRNQPDVLLPTRIGGDVWLGAGVKVLGGVSIGDGCIVGAGAVVTRDLPAYSIALGVPACVVRVRSE